MYKAKVSSEEKIKTAFSRLHPDGFFAVKAVQRRISGPRHAVEPKVCGVDAVHKLRFAVCTSD